MKKRSFWLITVLMTVALLGVFVMQLYYIREAYNLKSQLFDEQVSQALSAVVNKVQKRNVYTFFQKNNDQQKQKRYQDERKRALDLIEAQQKYQFHVQQNQIRREKEIESYLNEQDNIIRSTFLRPLIITEKDYLKLVAFDAKIKTSQGSIAPSMFYPNLKTFNLASPKDLPDTIRYLALDPQDGITPRFISLPKISDVLRAKFKMEDLIAKRNFDKKIALINLDSVKTVNSTINQLEDVAKEIREKDIPLQQRVNVRSLGGLLKSELLNHNITQPYQYKVASALKDSVLFLQVFKEKADFLPTNTYKTKLFGNDLFRDPGILYVSFPNKNSAILTNLGVTVASSVGLLLVLIFIFAYTLYAILKQKKVSEMKNDFINNMTHEFKTPVATIMIASEALKDPEVTEDKNRIKRLAGIIYDENVRLGNHIERVLSIARLEKNELKMEKVAVDMNELITIVLDSMSLQLQKRNASVHVYTEAENAVVMGDEMHLSNVIYNLVDNANKYSKDDPDITISTRNIGHSLVLEIADKGIGMSKEHTKRIFDQFYRVPTGNLHDVKGFGLGLNYVQDIVKQLNGSIKVKTEKDKGTTFEINLPS